MSEIILSDLLSFFQVLNTDESEIFTARILDKTGKGAVSGYGTLYGTGEELAQIAISQYEQNGGTLHVILNRTDDKGSGNKNVTSCRVLSVDIDSPTTRDTIKEYVQKYAPTCVVESSPDKFHLYWRVQSHLPLGVWEDVQLGLAVMLGGDRNLAQRCHSLRAPGIPRICKDGSTFTPRILHLVDLADTQLNPTLNFTDIFNKFQGLADFIEQGKKDQTKRERAIKGVLKDPTKLKKATALHESRNETIYRYIQHKTLEASDSSFDLAQAQELAQALVQEFPADTSKPPLEKWEIEKAARQGWLYGQMLLEEQRAKAQKLIQNLPQGAYGTDFNYDFQGRDKFSDQSVVDRVIQRFGSSLVRVNKTIYVFDSVRQVWEMETKDACPIVQGFVEQVVCDTIADPEFISEFCTEPNGSVSAEKFKQAERKYRSHQMTGVTPRAVFNRGDIPRARHDVFDANLDLVLCGNGVLDMKTGVVRAPRAQDYMLNNTDVFWNPDAKCSWWGGTFLPDVFAENEDPEAMVLFIQELFGYSLSGHISAQKIFCHFGDGCNGKSKILSALNALGGAYSTYIDPDDIVSKKNGPTKAMERIGAKIEGHRIVIVDDISTQTVWNEAFVKNLTSPNLRARAEHEKSREFKNRSSVHLGLNKAPNPEEENEGILRRVCLIPYNRQFIHDFAKSQEIDRRIEEELRGILVWAVKGYQRFVTQGGFTQIPEMTKAVTEYREAHFKDETKVIELLRPSDDPEDFVFLSDLTQEINNYLDAANEGGEHITPERLGIALKRKLKLNPEKRYCPLRKNSFKGYQVKRLYTPISKSPKLLRLV